MPSNLTFLFVIMMMTSMLDAVMAASFPYYSDYAGKPYNVTYDARSIRLNNEPVIFMSGSMHYPRFSQGQWRPFLQQAKSEGFNLIEIYVFWNGHEPIEGQISWSDRYNLTDFLEAIAENGLFANLRIGPYEWNLGGIPVWLQFNRPGIRYRSMNQQWLDAVQKWFTMVVQQTRPYFADRGGPIILAQIENELSGADQRYVDWNGALVTAVNVPIPWLMCNGQAANNTINTCNGWDCTGFLSTHGQTGRILVDQPAIWTENEMWFETWGGQTYPTLTGLGNRSSEDVAFAVARFYARGGCIHNYYMLFGGNHFDSTGGGGILTNYATGSNHQSDGLPNEPRFTHMNRFHAVLAEISSDLLSHRAANDHPVNLPYRSDATAPWKNGTAQLAFEYGSTVFVESSANVWLQTQYKDQVYDMSPNSIVIIRNGAVYWNSSAVKPVVWHRVYHPQFTTPLQWKGWSEPIFSVSDVHEVKSFNAAIPITIDNRPSEQLNITRDLTDYLWYSTKVTIPNASENLTLTIDAGTAEAFQLFIDGQFVSDTFDARHDYQASKLSMNIPSISEGSHILTLFAISLGIQNSMGSGEDPLFFHQLGVNRNGHVSIGKMDITENQWWHRPYVIGEWLNISNDLNQNSVAWTNNVKSLIGVPATWFTTQFPVVQPPPAASQYSILLDIGVSGLRRGHAFINGRDIGRYWNLEGGRSGQPSQRYYTIPPDWLKWGQNDINSLTVFDDLGVINLDAVRIVTSEIQYGQWNDDNVTEDELQSVDDRDVDMSVAEAR